jgi:hypothetical protein
VARARTANARTSGRHAGNAIGSHEVRIFIFAIRGAARWRFGTGRQTKMNYKPPAILCRQYLRRGLSSVHFSRNMAAGGGGAHGPPKKRSASPRRPRCRQCRVGRSRPRHFQGE